MRSASMQANQYSRGQQVEVRVEARNGRPEYWRKAKVWSSTNRGCEVQFADGPPGQKNHVTFNDLRPAELERPAKPPVRLGNTVLTAEQVEAFNRDLQTVRTMAGAPVEAKPAPVVHIVPPTTKESARHAQRSKLTRKHVATVIGSMLRAERLARGMTQIGASETLGINDQHISRIELGDVRPSDDDLLAYHDKFGLDLDLMIRMRDQLGFGSVAPKPEASAPAPAPVAAAPVIVAPEPPKPAPVPEPAPVPAERLVPGSTDEITAFLDFSLKLQELLPVPSRAALPEYNRLAAALWRLR